MTYARASLNQATQRHALRRWTVGERVGEYAFANYLGATERSEYLWFTCVTCGGLRKVTRGNTKQLEKHGCPVCRARNGKGSRPNHYADSKDCAPEGKTDG